MLIKDALCRYGEAVVRYAHRRRCKTYRFASAFRIHWQESKLALQETRQKFFNQFPIARMADEAFQASNNRTPSFFMATVKEDKDIKGAGYALTRMGENLERLLGIQGEVAFFFTSWSDFQHRAYNAMTSRLQEINTSLQNEIYGKVRFTPSNRIAFVVSGDRDLYARVAEWNLDGSNGTTLIPIGSSVQSPQELRQELVKSAWDTMGCKDLYRAQNPVSGQDFFGRESLIGQLSTGLSRGENFALYGLRRSGKSSVIEELRARGANKSEVLTKVDLQSLDDDSIDQMPQIIWEGVVTDLRTARDSTAGKKITLGSDADAAGNDLTFAVLGAKMSNLAKRNQHLRLIIAVDEIEWAVSLAKVEPRKVRSLLSALRATAQAASNVSLLFTGVANEMFQSSKLGTESNSVDNPLFGQVTPVYMEPFAEIETAALLRGLGAPMFLKWEDDAVHAVQEATGGFPYFVRDLASQVRRKIHDTDDALKPDLVAPRVVDKAIVGGAVKTWRAEGKQHWRQLVDALRRHYPEAADLMSISLEPGELQSWVDEDEDTARAADVLSRLGLLARDEEEGIRPSGPLAAFSDAREQASVSGVTGGEKEVAERAFKLIEQGEGHKVEFKSTARIDLATGKKSKDIELALTKTVAAFLNADGGTLIIGVSDDGQILGIEKDLALFDNANNLKGAIDRFERWLMADLLIRRLGGPFVSDYTRIAYPKIRGMLLAVVDVRRFGNGVWVDDNDFYVRTGNSTNLYAGAATFRYLREREG